MGTLVKYYCDMKGRDMYKITRKIKKHYEWFHKCKGQVDGYEPRIGPKSFKYLHWLNRMGGTFTESFQYSQGEIAEYKRTKMLRRLIKGGYIKIEPSFHLDMNSGKPWLKISLCKRGMDVLNQHK